VLRGCIARGRRSLGIDSQGRVEWPAGVWISSAEIMRDWLQLTPHQQGRASSTRLGQVMRRLGYQPARQNGERGWSPDTFSPPAGEVSSEVSESIPL
jgi:hypothetical protein